MTLMTAKQARELVTSRGLTDDERERYEKLVERISTEIRSCAVQRRNCFIFSKSLLTRWIHDYLGTRENKHLREVFEELLWADLREAGYHVYEVGGAIPNVYGIRGGNDHLVGWDETDTNPIHPKRD